MASKTIGDVLTAADAATDELLALHRDLVRIPTVNTGIMPTGNETDVCRHLEAFFQQHGIASITRESAPGRGNLVAELPGTTGRPTLLVMSHTDVVPVEDPSVWRFPPFSAEVADGKVWGRGSSDAKSLVSTGAMALVLLRRLGVPLVGTLRFLAAADEETGGAYGAGWVAREMAAHVRADIAINEGAGGPLQTPGGLAFGIANGEKGRYEVTITARGRSGHAASPWRAENALERASQVLQRLFAYHATRKTEHAVFARVTDLFQLREPIAGKNVDQIAQWFEATDEAMASLLRATSRMTLTPTMVRCGIKSNSIPATAVVTCDVRALPDQDAQYVRGQVVRLLDGIPDVTVEVTPTALATASPFDEPFLAACRASVRAATGQDTAELLPILTGGFTDSRFMRPLGIKVYGFMPSHVDAETADSGVHGVDERIEIAALRTRLRFMVALAAHYLGVASTG